MNFKSYVLSSVLMGAFLTCSNAGTLQMSIPLQEADSSNYNLNKNIEKISFKDRVGRKSDQECVNQARNSCKYILNYNHKDISHKLSLCVNENYHICMMEE